MYDVSHPSHNPKQVSNEAPVSDLFIIGGGINGCGIARDAAGRGLSVSLVEQGDFAGATSQWSTKLIHGGLRYLEYYEFRLVAESLREREVLLKAAPQLIQPLQFILPHEPHLRPRWMIAAGMMLYDLLGGKKSTPRSSSVRFSGSGLGAGLKPQYTHGFSYYDARADDARLTLANAVGARELGAQLAPRTRFVGARVEGGLWHIDVEDRRTGARRGQRAKMLVNAGGPWVLQVLHGVKGVTQKSGVKHVRGSHIVVPRLHEGEHAYILQNPDKRIVFIIPYQGRYSLIGTTDIPVDEYAQPRISQQEIDYLCQAASAYTSKPVKPADVVWTYSGVRPLYDDGGADAKAITRDYVLEVNESAGAPLLNIFGGKLTTYRKLAEHALEKMAPHFPAMQPPWTHAEPLPGGDIADLASFTAELSSRYPFLPHEHVTGMAKRHGSIALRWLGNASSIGDMGEHFGAGLYEREISHMLTDEWAFTAEDVLWRRSKCGLMMAGPERERLAAYIADRVRRTTATESATA